MPTAQPSTSEAAGQTPSRPASAAVGDALDLKGLEDGEALAVTVVKVVDPARAENEYSTPDVGLRFVAVQFRLKNTGTAVYSDSPSNGARLVVPRVSSSIRRTRTLPPVPDSPAT
ncbi:hypothetical protein ACH4O0_26375 [Streptomyces luteogriseus]|uniref:hypothetical protein n=1 Tax=Streptomyces luteogriseus TaxID=68233 RepID=UPI00379E7527